MECSCRAATCTGLHSAESRGLSTNFSARWTFRAALRAEHVFFAYSCSRDSP